MSTARIAKNSLWYGFELAFGAVTMLGSSIVLSRVYGPARLGYYNYLVWLTYVAGLLGSMGLPAAILKYMTEFLGQGKPGIAYRIFWMGFRAQAMLAAALVTGGVAVVWLTTPPEFRWVGFWLVVAIAPRMLGFMPGQVNSAMQDLARNIPSTLAANVVTLLIILASVWFDWGMLGLALSHPIGHTLDLIIKFALTAGRLREWKLEAGPPLEPALKRRVRAFAFQGLGLMVLNVVVWNRSDLILLKHLNPDISQVTFFSYSYSLVEKLLMIPQVVGASMGLNMLANQGREQSRLTSLAVSSASYLLLIGLPVLLGAVAMSRPLWMIYGDKFGPAVPVFIIMCLLAACRIVLPPAQTMLQATENQGFLLILGCTCAALNIGVDVWLIPIHGAVGAAIGNGLAQAVAAAGAWAFLIRRFSPEINSGALMRILLSAVVMAITAGAFTLNLPPISGAISGVVAGVVVYFAMLRQTKALRGEDRDRFLSLTEAFPPALRHPCNRILWTLIPPEGAMLPAK